MFLHFIPDFFHGPRLKKICYDLTKSCNKTIAVQLVEMQSQTQVWPQLHLVSLPKLKQLVSYHRVQQEIGRAACKRL